MSKEAKKTTRLWHVATCSCSSNHAAIEANLNGLLNQIIGHFGTTEVTVQHTVTPLDKERVVLTMVGAFEASEAWREAHRKPMFADDDPIKTGKRENK